MVGEIFADATESAFLDGVTRPSPAQHLLPGEEEVVAVWREGDVAALMSIWHDPEDDEEPYQVDVTVYERDGDRWKYDSRGGSDWPSEYGVRPIAGKPMLTGFTTGCGDWWLWAGLAPVGVDAITTAVDGEDVSVAVEPLTGAFLVRLSYEDAQRFG